MGDDGYMAVKQNEDRNYGTLVNVKVMPEEEEQSPATEEAASTQQVTNGVGSMHFHYDVYLLDFVGFVGLLDFEEAGYKWSGSNAPLWCIPVIDI